MSHFHLTKPESTTLLSSSPAWASGTFGPKMSNGTPWRKEEAEEDQGSEAGNVSERGDTEPDFSEDEGEGQSSVVREDTTINFFRPLCVADEKIRKTLLSEVIRLLEDSLRKDRVLVKHHLSRIVRFAYETPFKDLQQSFQQLIHKIQSLNDPNLILPKPILSPSYFIPKKLFPLIDSEDEEIRKHYLNLFLLGGRISHLNQVLVLHPSFFEKYFTTFNFIMREPGPLPLSSRNYIAILSSARYNCSWMIQMQEIEYEVNGGDKTWLKGIDHAPLKMQNLMPIIELLTHQPWRINKSHISTLLTGEESWSIGELVHAMVIISTFKALSSLVWACGVTAEVDFEVPTDSLSISEKPEQTVVPLEEDLTIDTTTIVKLLREGRWEDGEEEQTESFNKAETVEDTPPEQVESFKEFSRYIGNYTLKHKDFDVKSNEYFTFRVQDYNWKDHGYELFRRFLPGAAPLLDAEFDHIYQMTYNKFTKNDSNVNTFPFRRAIWQYVQRIRGMFHDDYLYGEVNIFLNKEKKTFIKKIVCFPETITKNDFSLVGYEFEPDEIVHIALLAVESARQSELLYGLQVVMKHTTHRD